MICYRTFEPGSIILVLRKDTKNRDFMNLVFLIDVWKVGLKDLYVNKDTLNGLFRKLTQHSPGAEFEEISRHDSAYLLARGLRIAKNVKTIIKPLTEKWLEKLGIQQIKLSGSLYKCYMCEENDLPENINKKI